MTPAGPVLRRRHSRGVRRLLAAAGVLGMTLAGLCVLLVAGVESGPVPFLTGLTLALLPVPLYLALARWIDRFEPEPRPTAAFAFFWGASVAVFVALILNTTGQAIVDASFGSKTAVIYGGSISAPIVEECAKAAALLAIFRFRRQEFNGVVDGIVYSVLVGLGFAMTENVLYYAQGTLEQGVEGAAGTFVVRGIMSPFAHPLFTVPFGMALGVASYSTARWKRVGLPVAGLMTAMLLHSAWNTAAEAGLILGVYVLLFVPMAIVVLIIALAARAREGRMIRLYLQPDVEGGRLAPDEVAELASLRARRRGLRAARRAAGRRARRARRAYHHAATELAFSRHRAAMGLAGEAAHEQRFADDFWRARARLFD